MVPNPAKKNRLPQGRKGSTATAYTPKLSQRYRELLAAHSPQPGTSVVLTNATINTINADAHTAQTELDAAPATHKATPPGYRCPRSTPASRSSTPKPN